MFKRSWFRRLLGALVLLLAASVGFSQSLRFGRAHRYLAARLGAAFGRPVEVARFSFSLLDGLRLEADSVTVAEDPRFGYEYFLRAERLTAGLRWRSLALGRFEFGTLSFTRPSLNLVRAADGHWNVESWLPPPGSATGPSPPPANPPARLYRIKVDGGRINIKLGADKHPFALADVSGQIEQESAGRWRLDLEARPVRAAVVLQEAGTLRLRGRIAGTSARLQPAELVLTWQDVSLADALRLARGRDFGVRGRLEFDLKARSGAAAAAGATAVAGTLWSFAGTARLTGAHRWDLPQRAGDPALNVSAEGQWRPRSGRVEFSKFAIEAPHSALRGAGKIEWAPTFTPQFELAASRIGWADALAWYRAFRPGVAESVGLDGTAELELTASGWPPRLQHGALSSSGALMSGAGFPEAVRIGRIAARVRRGRLELDPTTIAFPASAAGKTTASAAQPRTQPRQQRAAGSSAAPDNALRVEGALGPETISTSGARGRWQFEIIVAGQTDRAQDWLAAARAVGHTLDRGWSAEGPADLQLRWQGTVRPFVASAQWKIGLHGLALMTAYLNRPVIFSDAVLESRGNERRVTLAAAQAIGARWQGTLRRRLDAYIVAGVALPLPWEFDLAADHLDVADLDRWLGPRARPPGLLERLLPFAPGDRGTTALDTALSGLQARGRLRVEELLLERLSLRRLEAEAEIEGRNVTLKRAHGEFYKGSVKGGLTARLTREPSYDFSVQFDRVNLAALPGATATLRGGWSGVASGSLDLNARGIGRESLLASLEGRGTLSARDARLAGLDLLASFQAGSFRAGTSTFTRAAGRFLVTGRKIEVQELHLSERRDDLEAEGTVDFSRVLDLRVGPPQVEKKGSRSPKPVAIHIVGPLDAPRVTRLESAPARR